MNIAEKIVTLRKQKGLSQEALAEYLNISRQAVSRWEMGTTLPDAMNLLQLSKLFEVSTDYLLNDDYKSDQDIPAVKNQKDIILLIGIQIIAFVFHIVCCLKLVTFYGIPPIVSFILNLLMIKKIKEEFHKHHTISEKILNMYSKVYISIILLIFIIPMLSVLRILYHLFGNAPLY